MRRDWLRFDPATLLAVLIASLLPAFLLVLISYYLITWLGPSLNTLIQEPHQLRVREYAGRLDLEIDSRIRSLREGLAEGFLGEKGTATAGPTSVDLDLVRSLTWHGGAPARGRLRATDEESALAEAILSQLGSGCADEERARILGELGRLPAALEDPVGFSYALEARLAAGGPFPPQELRDLLRRAERIELATLEACLGGLGSEGIPFPSLPGPVTALLGSSPLPEPGSDLVEPETGDLRIALAVAGGGTLVATLPARTFLERALARVKAEETLPEGIFLELDDTFLVPGSPSGEGLPAGRPWSAWGISPPFQSRWQLLEGTDETAVPIPLALLERLEGIHYLWAGLVALVAGVGASLFLAAAASRRVQRSRRQDDFVRLVSHELKTPVSSIRMIAETLSLGRVRGEGQEREFLRQLEAESSRLTDLIERLLEHGRQDAARQVKREVVTDPGQLVDEAVTLFRERQAGVGEVLVRSSQVFHPVLIDREAVTGVLLNLLSNAQKFSPPETAIEVTVGEESRHLFIEVSDQGPGIRRRDRRRIFRPFFRGSNGTHQPGFGLGLSYCRQVAEAHKGRIRVVSAPGKGSAFTLEIPLALVAEGEEQDG